MVFNAKNSQKPIVTSKISILFLKVLSIVLGHGNHEKNSANQKFFIKFLKVCPIVIQKISILFLKFVPIVLGHGNHEKKFSESETFHQIFEGFLNSDTKNFIFF